MASSRDDTAGLTVIGTVVGTPGFMAPEQARGEGAGQASDVFALGATLLYAATGEGPYGRGAAELLMVRAAQGKVRPIPRSLPASLRQRLQAMLDPRPEKRPSAAALVGGPAGHRGAPTGRGAAVVAGRCGSPAAGSRSPRSLAAVLVVAPARPASRPTTTSHRRRRGAPTCPTSRAARPSPAPGTDGRGCLGGFEDYDEDAGNGCEAADDGLADDTAFPEGAEPIEGTIVPRDDVDTFAMAVGDGSQLLCDGRFTVRITAPEGMTLLLEVLDDDEVLGQTTSAHGVQGTVTLREEECFFSEARTLTARVSPSAPTATGGHVPPRALRQLLSDHGERRSCHTSAQGATRSPQIQIGVPCSSLSTPRPLSMRAASRRSPQRVAELVVGEPDDHGGLHLLGGGPQYQ